MHVATIEVIGYHRLALQILAQIISNGQAQNLRSQGTEAIMSAALEGGIRAWGEADPMDLANLITVIGEAMGVVDIDDIPTAADPAEAGEEPETTYTAGEE